MASAWQCIKIGTGACAKVVPIAPWLLAAYITAHPLPADCTKECHFVIPREAFLPGGELAPDTIKPPEAPPEPASQTVALGGTPLHHDPWAPGLSPIDTPLFLTPSGGTTPGGGEGGRTGGGIPPTLPGPAPRPPGPTAGTTQTGTPPTPGGSNVPEPASGLLLLVAMGALGAIARRRLA